MTWTAMDVRFRFIEAADTLMHLQVMGVRPARTGNAWTMAVGDWQGYGADTAKVRHRPDPSAISRYEEVQDWLHLIGQDDDRTMVWARAMCEAARQSFGAWCAQNSIVRRTADRRTDKAYSQVADILRKRGVPLRPADEIRLSTIGAVRDTETPKMAYVASPGFERTPDARPEANLPDDPKAFERWLAKTNAARRKEQERRRRAKLQRSEDEIAA